MEHLEKFCPHKFPPIICTSLLHYYNDPNTNIVERFPFGQFLRVSHFHPVLKTLPSKETPYLLGYPHVPMTSPCPSIALTQTNLSIINWKQIVQESKFPFGTKVHVESRVEHEYKLWLPYHHIPRVQTLLADVSHLEYPNKTSCF